MLSDRLQDLAREVVQSANTAWHRLKDEPPSTLMQILRPNLPPGPNALRCVAEPLVAAAAMLALLVLGAVGVLSSFTLLLALGLAFAIITRVFGIELSLDVPMPRR